MLIRSVPIKLDNLLEQNAVLPVCPAVFVRLTQALNSPDDHQTELTEILSSDPSLTSRVLHVANSALYGMPRQVRSIKEAILRVGFREIWSIASALQAKSLFRSDEGWTDLNRLLWEHSLRTAAVSRVLVQRLSVHGADETFTAALLHDLGKTVLQSFEPQYELLCQNGALIGRELTYVEADFFGIDHAHLGGQLLLHWDLPESLASLVADHHSELPAGTKKSSVPLLLALSNELAHAMTCEGVAIREAITQGVSGRLLNVAELTLDSCADLTVEAARQFETLSNA